jgi:hypothetical protein
MTNIWGHIAKHMGTRCQEYTWNIIDYQALHESRSTLNFMQQPRQSCIQQGHVPNNPLIADWQKYEHIE